MEIVLHHVCIHTVHLLLALHPPRYKTFNAITVAVTWISHVSSRDDDTVRPNSERYAFPFWIIAQNVLYSMQNWWLSVRSKQKRVSTGISSNTRIIFIPYFSLSDFLCLSSSYPVFWRPFSTMSVSESVPLLRSSEKILSPAIIVLAPAAVRIRQLNVKWTQ